MNMFFLILQQIVVDFAGTKQHPPDFSGVLFAGDTGIVVKLLKFALSRHFLHISYT